jgi:hypothetical protein
MVLPKFPPKVRLPQLVYLVTPAVFFNVYRWLLRVCKVAGGVTLTTHSHLVAKLGLGGVNTTLLHMPSWHAEGLFFITVSYINPVADNTEQ